MWRMSKSFQVFYFNMQIFYSKWILTSDESQHQHFFAFGQKNKTKKKKTAATKARSISINGGKITLNTSLYLTLIRAPPEHCIQFRPPQDKKNIEKLDQWQWMATKGAGVLPLWEAGLVKPGEEMASEVLAAPSQFTMGMAEQWSRLPREVRQCPSLEVFKMQCEKPRAAKS